MESKMINDIVNALENEYIDAKCSLDFTTPLELLIAVILSAQSTDAMINKITPRLFSELRTAKDFAECDILRLEKLVKSSGFYHNKKRRQINHSAFSFLFVSVFLAKRSNAFSS